MSAVQEKPVQKTGHFAVAQRVRVIEEERKRVHKRLPWQRFAAAAKELDKDWSALAADIGYSTTMGKAWKKDGNCPMVAVIAAEAMVERRKLRTELTRARQEAAEAKPVAAPSPVRLLVSFPDTPEKLKALLSFCDVLGIVHQFFEPSKGG